MYLFIYDKFRICLHNQKLSIIFYLFQMKKFHKVEVIFSDEPDGIGVSKMFPLKYTGDVKV